ncbi:PepSY-associated TM helix domain-containing protein [Methylophaga thalassica]|uniref:PepSY-associated TM helix domain-containing protein n=1 Tax=Methylophaga aminisulfidivorans TaxID=230105 RepID=UPI003A92D2F9
MRKFWIEFHRISGLILFIPLFLQSVSGAIIVFDHAIDEWLNPQLVLDDGISGPPASIAEVMYAALHALPDVAHINSLRTPRNDKAMYTAFVEMNSQSPLHGKTIEVMINPYTADVVSVREWGSYFTSMIYLFHFTFLLGENMELVLGLLAILMLANVIVGVYYGWPRSKKAWNWLLARTQKSSSTIARLRRTHIALGLISLPVFIVLIITGISLIFPDQTKWLLNRPAKASPDVDWLSNHPIQPDHWLISAKQYWPEKQWQRIIPPSSQSPSVEIRLNADNDPRKTSGSFVLWLNPQTNQILAEQSYDTMSLRQKTAFWLFPLHSGEAFDLTGRIIVFITGIFTAVLSVAGGCLWYRRKFKRQHQKRFI